MRNSGDLSEIFKAEFSGLQTVGILGYGREGKSSYKLIRKCFPEIRMIIADRNTEVLDSDELKQDGFLELIGGSNYLQILGRCDLVFVSPGISITGSVLPDSIRMTSQTDFLFRHFSQKIVAVTGTKGKSTTASLIAHMLRQKFSNVPLAGNIGIPPFDIIEQLAEVEVAVFEVSSHQLQFVSSAPKVALLLNLFPEHLDYYPDVTTYFDMKKNIFRFQKQGDCIVRNEDDPEIVSFPVNHVSDVLHYSVRLSQNMNAWCENDVLYCRNKEVFEIIKADEIQIRGKHNISNSLAAICACSFLGLTPEEMHTGIKTFRGLPHRMEKIDSGSGQRFFNDSIATIPEATLAAIEALHPVETLILGGMDRGLSYDEFLGKVQHTEVRNFCFYGEAGLRMFQEVQKIHSLKKNVYFRNFEECVLQAISMTGKGETCLLSPAASSYDQFRNFEERGEAFRNIIHEHCC